MKKLLFGRKAQQPVQVQPQQYNKQPIDGPPSPAQQYPYPATQPRSQADHWNPIPVQERSDSFASSYSQPPLSQPATPSTAPPRSSFQLQSQQQQQQQHFVASSRQSSQDSPASLAGGQDWVVVDQQQANLGGGIDTGRFIRAQPSFESRSSSLASLPAGASPPIPYPTTNPQPSPISPFGVNPAPPPPQQQQVNSPLGRQNTTTKRLIPLRKSSVDAHTPRTTRQPPVTPLRNISSSTEELSLMSSQAPSHDGHKPKRGFLDWLAGDKEKIARAQHATERSLSPDPTGQNWGLTKLMGFMTATASEDWTLLMEVCEQASTEAGAKEAAKALRYEIKYAEAPAMLSAARLWAIMLRNTQAPFVQATSAKKFLDVVEDALNNPDTSPVVRDRLMFVLAGASAQFGNKFPNFRSSWRKVKPREAPVEGIPFDPKDPMFQPPSRRLPKPGFIADPTQQQQQQRPISAIEILPAPPTQSRTSLQSANNHPLPPVPNAQHPVVLQGVDVHLYPEEPQQRREREYSNGGGVVALDSPQVATQRDKRPKQRPRISQMIISPEEDIRRLFQECEIAKSNAGLLTNAMTYAKPEEIVAGGSDGLIREFYLKCMHSQEIITAQIPWATAQSERARAAFLQQHPEAADNPQAHTVEEELLSEILMAHQELLEAFRVYEENEKLAAQEREIREVQERSKVETRLDRTQIQYYAADGSFMTQPAGGGAGGSGSRSPSPAPPIIQGDHAQSRSSPGPRAGQPLPTPPGAGLGVPNAYDSQQHHPNGSSHTLAPPPHAPHGPRHPRSRSPSPDGQRRSVDLPRSTTATPGISGAATPNGAAASSGRLDTLRRGMSKLGLDVKRTRSGSSASGRGRRSAEVANGVAGHDDDDEIKTPIQPSAKALGKRKADPAPEDAFDPDDIFKERNPTPMAVYPAGEDNLLNSDSDSVDDGNGSHKPHIEYAYDAAAERKKELEREAKKAAKLRSAVPLT